MLPKIGITTVHQANPRNGSPYTILSDCYIDAVSRTGGLPLLLPIMTDEAQLDLYVREMDGFIFSGGIDVSPSFYGENPHALLGDTSIQLDRCQIPLMQKIIAARKPFLAICRGNQVLNVACGGTLYQDNTLQGKETFKHMQATDRGDISHLVHLEPGSTFHRLFGDRVWTNSYHHQSVRDLGEGLRICGRAEDGIVEAIELVDYPCGLGIQWHPEIMFHTDDHMKPLFEELIKAACR
ncbi:MAG: gamma-glutamyl-gamma-aminobutyrate hydrolase family protein [Lachnospiraceae bacterium]|nr:gamma-glutamyl-gamma-aminobutyrate hydrolase family protein [Lachnospiraceae bacterium]